jgi:hypothetical protein
MINRVPKFLIAAIAIVAAISILVVLVTPAPDELPSTGPHSLSKLFVPASIPIYLPKTLMTTARVEMQFLVVSTGLDVLALTCSRLC